MTPNRSSTLLPIGDDINTTFNRMADIGERLAAKRMEIYERNKVKYPWISPYDVTDIHLARLVAQDIDNERISKL